MRKKLFFLSLLLLGGITLMAQQNHTHAQKEKSVYQRITNLETKSNRFNLFLNMNGSFDAEWNNKNSDYNFGHFNMRQLRIEAKGNINERFSYRWRQRLNRPNNPGVDNMPTSIDIAGLGVNITDRFSMFAGKQCAAYGGIEFDLNPIEIYEYSDMIENMSNFLTGVNFAYQLSPNHQLQFQILNSLNHGFSSTYNTSYDPRIYGAKIPLVYTLNWNGNMFDGAFQTRWSASVMSQTSKKHMFYMAFGNQLNLSKNFDMFVDVMYSREDLDRKGIISRLLPIQAPDRSIYTAQNANYLSFVAKANIRFAPRWNWFIKGMYETASVGKDFTIERRFIEKGKFSTSLGYFTGIEYYPMSNSNLHFFLTYVGRSFKYEKKLDYLKDFNTNRVSLGFIYQLPMF
ncbi:Uncharacterised protein [Porphyromonas macacae]|uniref:Phosphate-selective porin n=1 Tax=Porphyromonas macacae TaxID=28115 RepID=A0A379E8P7_9PORP|nr:porin [Porphyromonas macacae]SUB88830.1 Uncharacterised protein [Porphyromonas macacae]